jgi:hypothetical protein
VLLEFHARGATDLTNVKFRKECVMVPKVPVITGRIEKGCFFSIKETELGCEGPIPLYDVYLISHLCKDEVVDYEMGLTPAGVGEWLLLRMDY